MTVIVKQEHGTWFAYKEYKGKQVGIAGFGSTKAKALADYNEQQSAKANQKEFNTKW